jgi:flagellar basal-body rod modification protein FlgD
MTTGSSISQVASQNTQATSTPKKTTLTQEDFMKLFTKQLQYQDPLAPMDNYQMATQMAQLTTVQALNDMTKSIQNMEAYQASVNSLQAIGLIGKKVEARGNTLSIDQGKVSEGSYQLARPGKVSIQIFDSHGNLVRSIDGGVKDTSKQKIVWDGKNQQGASLPEGNYIFKVAAGDEKNQPIEVKTFKVGTVTGISLENGITYLKLGPDKITINEMIAVLA